MQPDVPAVLADKRGGGDRAHRDVEVDVRVTLVGFLFRSRGVNDVPCPVCHHTGWRQGRRNFLMFELSEADLADGTSCPVEVALLGCDVVRPARTGGRSVALAIADRRLGGARRVKRKTHNALVLEVLADGGWHDHHELYALNVIVHSRVADLRKLGYSIERSTSSTEAGESRYLYRLTGVAPVDLTPRVLALEAQLEESARARIESFRARAASPAQAAVAQLVERDVANVEAAGSSPASRSCAEVPRLFEAPAARAEREYQSMSAPSPDGQLVAELRGVEDELAAMELDGFDVQTYDELVGRRRELEDRLFARGAA